MIHPTAIIEEGAKIAATAKIGPYCVVGPNVEIEDGVELVSHISITGNTKIGEETTIFPFASIGHPPQDLKYKGEDSKTIIGKRNKIREYVTINPGTEGDKMLTQIGDDCLLMVGSHVAHDCILGNKVILANNATLAGHVVIGNNVIIGGLAAVRQFVRIGDHVMVGGLSGVESDIIPYGLVVGERARLAGLNLVGLKRRGFSSESIHDLRQAFQDLFDDMGTTATFAERLKVVTQNFEHRQEVKDILDFIKGDSIVGRICLPK